MFPKVSNNIAIQDKPVQQVRQFIKKSIKMQRQVWLPSYQLQDFSIPQVITSPNMKKKFKIQIHVRDSNTQQQFSKTIYFGDQTDYMFSKNPVVRAKRLAKIQGKENPLESAYWRALLCNQTADFKQNVKKMVDFLIQSRLSKVTIPIVRTINTN